jgi:hypothetical protein
MLGAIWFGGDEGKAEPEEHLALVERPEEVVNGGKNQNCHKKHYFCFAFSTLGDEIKKNYKKCKAYDAVFRKNQ